MITIDTPLDTQFRYNVFVDGASRGEVYFEPKYGVWEWYHDGRFAAKGFQEPGARRKVYDIIGQLEHCQESDIALLVRDAQAQQDHVTPEEE